MRYSLFILESELEQYVEYFAKVIIAKSPIDSIRSGSNKPDLSRMIWSRGDLVFALHHHFVNLTSRSYINTPLMIDLTQKLTVGWGITFPLNNKKINHKDYWDFFARFMAEEFYLKIAETHDNDSESSDDHSFQPICNGHIRLTQEEIKKYFSLTNNTNKTALLNKISSKKILKNTPAYYKFFDRYEDGKGLMEHLGENVRYIKETLSLCELVDKQSRDNSIYFNNIEIISDDKLFLIYIYYLYRYCEEKDHGKSGSSQSTEPQKSGDSQPTEPQNSDETKDNEVSFAPPQLIALPKYDPQKSNIEVNGFECIGNEELLSLHQIITIPTKKQADKKAKNELSEIVIATHAKEKIIAIQNALGLPHSKITETNRFQLEQVIRNLAATYLKVNAGLIIVLFVVLFGGGIGGTILIVGNFNQRTQEVEKLETKLANMTRIIDIPVSQKIQEYLIPDSSFRHQ